MPAKRNPRPTPANASERIGPIIKTLKRQYPDAKCALEHADPLELLVATILSAQCTDARVNLVTKDLFRKYRSAEDYANANPEEFEQEIRSTGFFRNKTKSILGMAQALVDHHGGKVPASMDELTALPGVGRKTANVVLGNAFEVPGITVDTHVGRLVRRFGWTEETDPVKVEHAVGALIPRREWTQLSHVLIFHGRRVCHARKPACGACPVHRLCPSSGIGENDPTRAAAMVKDAPPR